MRISVFGLGKLGSPLAAVLAARGFQVVGTDVREKAVTALRAGRAPVVEPGLPDMIDAAQGRLTATADGAQAVADTDVTFIIVPTPSLPDGRFSMAHVLEAARTVGRGLAAKDGYHLVVLTSTVMPGDSAGTLRPALEQASGKRCGPDFGLCYGPEFIALGNVVPNLLEPDFILIGEEDARSGETLARLYKRMCRNDPPLARMNFVNAELAKLAVNNFITMRISYANMLARICEKLPGADVDVVTQALGLDSRIGPKYLRGAMSFGGPCFPRDNVALNRLAADVAADSGMTDATRTANLRQMEHLADVVTRYLRPGGTAGILGLSYKPDTPVIEESPSIDLARRLAARGYRVAAYDPQAMPAAKAALDGGISLAGSAAECAGAADVLVVAVPWKEFRSLRPEDLKSGGAKPAVIDCWRILERERFAGVCTYVTLGTGAPAKDAGRAAARPKQARERGAPRRTTATPGNPRMAEG